MSDKVLVPVPVEFLTVIRSAFNDGESTDVWSACRDLVRYLELGEIEAAPEPVSAEPVAYMLPFGNGTFTFEKTLPDYVEDIQASDWLPLYTSPPAHEWISMADKKPDIDDNEPSLLDIVNECRKIDAGNWGDIDDVYAELHKIRYGDEGE